MEEDPDSKIFRAIDHWMCEIFQSFQSSEVEKHVYTDTNREFIEFPSQLCWTGISVLGLLQNGGPNLLKEKPQGIFPQQKQIKAPKRTNSLNFLGIFGIPNFSSYLSYRYRGLLRIRSLTHAPKVTTVAPMPHPPDHPPLMHRRLGTWTPASGSLQPRAPDPGEYGVQVTSMHVAKRRTKR